MDDKTECSFYDMLNENIHISYKQLSDIDYEEMPSNDKLEDDIRCLLYHEISHAYLTPNITGLTPYGFIHDVFNIFEDERIETILKHYYRRVNFKSFVFKLNNFTEDMVKNPGNARNFFYVIVRFRRGPEELVNRVQRIIESFKDIKKNSKSSVYYYLCEIMNFYRDCEKYFEENFNKPKPELPKENKINNDEPSDYSDEMIDAPNESEEDEDDEEINGEAKDKSGDIKEDESEDDGSRLPYDDSSDEIKDAESIIEKAINDLFKYESKEVANALTNVLFKRKGMKENGRNGQASYSGRIDPRLIGRKAIEDYKWFVNKEGDALRKGSQLTLNLFIDRSGSFRKNDDTVNCILKELRRFEKSRTDFKLNLTVMNTFITKIDLTKDFVFYSEGGNALIKEEVERAFNQVQGNPNETINIILFDGDATTDRHREATSYQQSKSFKIFNQPNCIIISDKANQSSIESYCKKAKSIITNNYCDELKQNIINALSQLLK